MDDLNIEASMAVIAWGAENFNKFTFPDQLTFIMAACDFAKTIKPIYDEYHADKSIELKGDLKNG